LVIAVFGLTLVTPVFAKQERKEAREAFKTSLTQTREEYKQKLAQIKDERKKVLLEKFNEQVAELNARRTSEMAKNLEQITTVLNRFLAKGSVSDVGAAKLAIEEAKQAVSAQAAKVYVISISDESKLREDANKVKSQLQSDLKAVQEKVKAARMAVYEVVKGGI